MVALAVPENESPFSSVEGEFTPGVKPKNAPRSVSAKKGGKGTSRASGAGSDKRSADKRERILKAAIKVFARKGFYAARVSEIAKAAGVADGTIYLYFRNKDDVLVSVFEDRITQLVNVLRETVATDASFEHRFRRVVELQLGLLEGQRDLAEVVTVNLRQSPKMLKQYALPLFTQYLEVIASLIADGQQRGDVHPDVNPRVIARALWGALDGVAVTWALGGGEPSQLSRAAQQVSSFFLSGLLSATRPRSAHEAMLDMPRRDP